MDLFSLFTNFNNGTTTDGTAAVKAEPTPAPVAEAKPIETAKPAEVKAEPVEEVKADEPKKDDTKIVELPKAEDVKADDKPETPVITPNFNISDLPVEEDDESDDASDDSSDDGKDDKKKKTTKKKAEKKLDGPVTVKGTGWSFTYGTDGGKYTSKEVLKAAFEAGYKEVIIGSNRIAADSTIICKTITQTASFDDKQMGDSLTVLLGNFRVTYEPSQFEGLSKEEVSVFDVALKFGENNPDFKGCSLAVDFTAGVATPVFSESFKPKKGETYLVWTDNGNKEFTGDELIDGEYVIRKSDSDILFLEEKVDTKANVASISASDLGLEKVDIKVAKELYHLPFTLYLQNFGQKFALTSDAFGGKEAVEKDDLIAVLKPKYKMFRQSNREVSVSYDKASSTVGVAVVSGRKGAAAIAAPFSNVINFSEFRDKLTKRVEDTEVGLFKGYQNDETLEVTGLSFSMKLPKIPSHILDTIVAEFRRDITKENMVQIMWSAKDKEYYVVKPTARYTSVSVFYELTHTSDILVMTVHSHNKMKAFWSSIDDNDEVNTSLFGVIGNLDQASPSMLFRAGMEGCFKALDKSEVFDFGGECA